MTRIIVVACVLATLSAGGTADAAPIAGSVADGPSADIDFQQSQTRIDANWSGFSDPSGIADYEWAIGTTPGATDAQGFTSVGTATSASNASLTLTEGPTYYVTVRATSGAGPSSTASSDGVRVDTTRSSGGRVNDGPGADIEVQTSLTRIDANWSGYSDPESGIADYAWGIGSEIGRDDVQALTSVGLATSATATGLSLTAGKAYYVTLQVTNGAGAASGLATSNGVIVVVPDTTPPIAGFVNDGFAEDIDTQPSNNAFYGNWEGFSDPESGIARYESAIGTTPGGTDVLPFTHLGPSTSFLIGLSMPVGTTYYVSIRATNGGGLSIIATSDGVTVSDGPEQPTASPAAIDFGPVAVGQSSSAHQVTVRNDSAITWYVASAASDSPEFAVDATGLPSSLTPGQEGVLSLTFHPEVEGPRTGVLSISFAGGAAPNTIALRGTGVTPEPPRRCGCASGGGGGPAAAAFLALGLTLARRRRAARATR